MDNDLCFWIFRIETIRCTALLCLNNILQKIDVKDLGGPSKLLDLSNNLSNLLFKKTGKDDFFKNKIESVLKPNILNLDEKETHFKVRYLYEHTFKM